VAHGPASSRRGVGPRGSVADPGQLLEYQAYAIHGFLYSGLGVYNYHQELADGDLEDFDVPGWGPEAPVLVEAGDAAHRLYFTDTQFELLKYWHPFPVGIFHLTAGREFSKTRTRTFATKELAKALVKYYPTYRNVRHLALKYACPEGVGEFHLGPDFESDEEFNALINFYGPEAHFIFYKLMRKWAPILKEKARIKISWVKRTTFPGLPESKDPEEPLKTWWTIEAPRWKNPDRFRRTWAIFHEDE
jgi:hypothetical protein